MIGIVREVYEHYGFQPLETPAFENIETLLGKYGDEGNQLIFKILKRGEHEGSGAADLTVARNEFESFQVAVRADGAGIDRLKVEASELTGARGGTLNRILTSGLFKDRLARALALDPALGVALALVRREELHPAIASLVYVTRPPHETPTGRLLGSVHLQRLLREAPHQPVGSVLDDLDRAAKHGDLEEGGPFTAIATKLRGGVERVGLKPFGAAGEAFDPRRRACRP